ncbi:MAG: DUF6390 family protein, partial [Candidatus Limnocylindrales bacterium]
MNPNLVVPGRPADRPTNGLADRTLGSTPAATSAHLPNAAETSVNGAILFARYAYQPNELGYCGPPDSRALLDYGAEQQVDRGLVELAKGFAGAWPYLELIARATGLPSPLDRRGVEAYWLGSDLLESIDMATFGNSLAER